MTPNAKLSTVESETRSVKLKKALKKVLSSSSAHGIPNIIKAKHNIIRLAWIISFIFSLAVCIYFIATSIKSFLDFDVITKIEEISEQVTEFPTVSFCKYWGFNESLSEIIAYCRFGFDEDCQHNPEKYFEPFIDNYYGRCFSFNSGKNFTGHQRPILNSNQIGVYKNFWLSLHINDSSFNTLMVVIHNRTNRKLRLDDENQIIVMPGSLTYLPFDRIFYHNLPAPYSSCIEDISLFGLNQTLIKYFQNTNINYRHDVCLGFCFDLLYNEINNCKCTAPIGKVLEKCDGIKLVNKSNPLSVCTWKFKKEFTTKLFNKCHEYCPIECDYFTYTLTPSALVFPNTGYVNQKENNEWFHGKLYNKSYVKIKKSYYSFLVYYTDLKYTSIRQYAKTGIDDLIANIGGTLGLFIGISFLSFIEILDLFVEFALICFQK